jgi:hypothetical protein
VTDLWREWTVGLAGGPAVQSRQKLSLNGLTRFLKKPDGH